MDEVAFGVTERLAVEFIRLFRSEGELLFRCSMENRVAFLRRFWISDGSGRLVLVGLL